MLEEDKTSRDTQDSKTSESKGSLRDLRGVFIAALWVFIGLLLVAIFWPNLPQRMIFFTGTFFNLIIAFAVIAQVVIYRKQWHVMRLQWHEANREAKSSAQLIELMVLNECAYVRIGTVDIEWDGKSVGVEGTFINGGRTPAWNFRYAMRLALVGLEEVAEYHPTFEIDDSTPPTVIVANTPPKKFNADPVGLSQEQIAKIHRKEVQVWFDGLCRYDDSLGGRVYYSFGFLVSLEQPIRTYERYQNYHREKANPN